MSLRLGVLDVERLCLRIVFSAWKNEMLEIFNEYNLNKYITSPCVPPIDPLNPTPCRISGSGKTLKVRTLGCARRSSPYRNTSSALLQSLS